MNIIKRISNNLKYAKYRKLRDKALYEMKKHEYDTDKTEWIHWASIGMESIKKCRNIPLH